jgi:predicted PurR-regulated permease PerM
MTIPDREPPGSLRGISITLRSVAIAAAAALAVWLTSGVLLLAFFAALLAILLRGAAVRVARRTGMPDWLALAVVLVACVLLIAAAALLAGPALADQFEKLSSQLVSEAKDLQQRYGQTAAGHWVFSHLANMQPSGGPALTAAGSTLGALGGLVAALIAALYFAAAPEVYVNGLVRLLPIARRPRGRDILGQVGTTLWWWLLGQAIDMVVVGVLTGVGLAIVGVPLSPLLGLITGLLTFIPYLGAIAAAVPAVLLGFSISGATALWALGVFVAAHCVDAYVISPMVQKRMVNLPPALTILSLVFFGFLFGTLGAILGPPLAAAALVIVQQAYLRDTLGDREF